MTKRKRKSVPLMLFWSKRDQQRFIESIEKLVALVNDLEKIVEPAKRRKAAKQKPAAVPSSPAAVPSSPAAAPFNSGNHEVYPQ